VHPSEWDRNRQRVRSKEPEAIEINNYLDAIRARLYYLEKVLIDRDIGVSPQLLRDAYLDRLDCLKEWTLMKVVEVHLEDLRAKIGESIAASTVWEYELCGRLIERYIKHRYSRNDMSIKEVKIGFISGFHAWLLKERKMKQNSATKHLKFLQKIMNIAVMNGYIPYNTLSMYKVVREPVKMEYLDENELQRVIDFNSPLEHLVITKDMFLFGCFTGLSYVDIKMLRSEHFETDCEGRKWIKKRREKTGVLSRIPVLPIAQSILDKYSGGKVLLPMPDNADVNRYLKDIAVLCGIDKRVCFHTSRHTFATTVTLAHDIPLEIVSQMMGHTNTRMTSHYAKVIDRSIGNQMDTLVSRYKTVSGSMY
jgi:integrase